MMKTNKLLLFGIVFCLAVVPIHAQKKSDRSYIRSGNRNYADSVWNKAEIKYRKAIPHRMTRNTIWATHFIVI